MSTTPAFLTAKQVAAELNISRGTVYAMIKSGDLPAVAIGAGKEIKHIRIKRTELEAYIARASGIAPGSEKTVQ